MPPHERLRQQVTGRAECAACDGRLQVRVPCGLRAFKSSRLITPRPCRLACVIDVNEAVGGLTGEDVALEDALEDLHL